MANRTASIYMNCKTADGKWRYYPPSKAANGRLEPGVAIVNNRRTKFEDFNYYVSWYEGIDDKGKQKKRFEKCGIDATFAAARRLEIENSLHAEVAPARLAEIVNANARLTIADAVATYLSDVSARRGEKTAAAYKWVMKLFTDNCTKTHLDQINQNDLRAVIRILQAREVKKGQKVSKRTVFNQFQAIGGTVRFPQTAILAWYKARSATSESGS
jgi:hypothetical protein